MLKKKKYSTQRDRRKWITACLDLWSLYVRSRDGYKCQWCGKYDKKNHAHHIVARSISNTMAQFDVNNGMTLCYKCHIHKLKADPDEYIKFRDEWLFKRGLDYRHIRLLYSSRTKLCLTDLKVLYYHMKDQYDAGKLLIK